MTRTISSCQQLGADVSTISRLPAIPVQGIQQHWSLALQDLREAAKDCVSSVTNPAESRLSDRYASLVNAAVSQADAATSSLKKELGSKSS
ncbi:MAG: hypothetical protein ACRDVP_12270 [Acidimicrobiales bacterium]